MSLTERFLNWCQDPSSHARFERTIVQGLLSVLITQLPQFVSSLYLPDWANAILIPGVMCVLAAIQGEIGKDINDYSGNHFSGDDE